MINSPVGKKWARNMSRQFINDEIQMSKKTRKCSTSLVVRDIQNRFLFIVVKYT